MQLCPQRAIASGVKAPARLIVFLYRVGPKQMLNNLFVIIEIPSRCRFATTDGLTVQ